MNYKEVFKDRLTILIIIIVSALLFTINKGNTNAQVVINEETAQQQDNSVVQQNEIIYFYGQECPHCKDAEKFIKENNIADKVSFIKKEVWHNQENADEMQQKVAECNLQKEGIGVPLVFAKKINSQPKKFVLSSYSIEKGNNLWNIIKKEIETQVSSEEQEQATIIVDSIKDKFKKLSTEKLKEIGFSSGSISKLKVSDKLNLSSLGEDIDINLIKCYVGTPDVEAFFKQEAGIQ